MKYKEYDQAVKDLYDLVKVSDDENVQALWEVVSNLWADNEDYVVNSLCED